MTENHILLDPTAEVERAERARLPRLDTLQGKTVGLLDISKAKGDILLDRLETKLTELGATVKRYAKPTFARVAPVDLKQEISTQCHAVIEALADYMEAQVTKEKAVCQPDCVLHEFDRDAWIQSCYGEE